MPPPIAVGIGLGTQPPLSRPKTSLRAAKAAGMDSAWVIDHFLGFFPPQIWDGSFSWAAKGKTSAHAYYDWQALLGYLAPRAGNVQLGVGVTESLRRHPVLLAQTAMTISHLTNKAPILGIGAGERENTEPYGVPFDRPVSRLEEALKIIRLCFSSSGEFEFRGEFFDMPDAVMDLRPAPGRTPELWVAAHGPRMLELTGAYGDGWYPTHAFSPTEYAEKLTEIGRAATAAGRSPDQITPAMQALVVLGKTDARARAMLSHRALRFIALLSPDSVYKAVGATHPLGDGFKGIVDFIPQRYSRDELLDAVEAVDPEMLAERMIWGGRTKVIADLRAYGEAGMRHVMLSPASGLVSKSDAAFAVRTLPGIAKALRKPEA